MPQIGWFEILLIVIVSILVIGPKDFPIMLKKIGSWIGYVKRYFNELQSDVASFNNETDNKKSLKDYKEVDKNKKDEK